MTLKLAWRNLWRNKRRTFITLAAIFLAVILSTLMMSLKEGVYESMIESSVGSYMGYVRVHAEGYWEEKSLDLSMEQSDEVEYALFQHREVDGSIPRVESFALAASEELTKGSMVVGVDPTLEAKFNKLNERVVEGSYLEDSDRAVLLGDGLAAYLHLSVGDTIVLLGQGYHSASAAGKYPVKGIVKFGSPDLSKQLIFMPLKEAQWLYAMPGKVSGLILHFNQPDRSEYVADQLKKDLGAEYEVMHWTEHNRELANMIKTDRMEGWVFMFILYLVIAFGIFSTILMMLEERRHEFGVLIAIGMKRMRLAAMVFGEVVIISLLGAFIGMFGAFPVCLYFNLNPIQLGAEMQEMTEDYGMEAVLRSSVDPGIFIQQALIVAALATLIAIYPYIKLTRLRAIDAMRS
ncbi:MAG: ABC transporter permease [Flavobacteriales bacterium]|nr:ABC transporter permease [Flavobacteriales bacterium]